MSQLTANDPFLRDPALNRLTQQQQIILSRGDPLAIPEDESVPFSNVFVGLGQLSMVGAMRRGIERAIDPTLDESPFNAFGRRADPDFNPYQRILDIEASERKLQAVGQLDRPVITELPAIQRAIKTGHFDQSVNENLFAFDLETALYYQESIESLQKASNSQMVGAFLAVMVGDPINLLPGGIGIKAANSFKTLGAAQRMAIATSLAAGGALSLEKIQNAIQPYSNDPNLSNELIALSLGGAIGAAFGGYTLLRMNRKVKIGTRKINRTRELLNESMVYRMPDAPDNELSDLDTLINDSVMHARLHADNLDPVDNTALTLLRTPETEKVIRQIERKYAEAGKSLHMVEHPAQRFYDTLQIARRFLDTNENALIAGSRDLDANAIDTAYGAINRAYIKLQDKALGGMAVNPEGRLTQITIGRIAQLHRVLSGSAQTISKGSAVDPVTFNPGTSAEGLKNAQRAAVDQLRIQTRRIISQARREGRPIRYNGQEIGTGRLQLAEHARAREAIGDYLSRRSDADRFAGEAALPDDAVDPLIREAADNIDAHFRNQLKLLDEAGFIERGPAALQRAEGYLERAQATLSRARNRLEEALQLHPLPQPLKTEGLSDAEAIERLQRTIAAEARASQGMVDRVADSQDELTRQQRNTIARAVREGDPRAEFATSNLRPEIIRWAENTGFDPGLPIDKLLYRFNKPFSFGGKMPQELLDRFDTFGQRTMLEGRVKANVPDGQAEDFIVAMSDELNVDGWEVFEQIIRQSTNKEAGRFELAKGHAIDNAELDPDMGFRAYYDNLPTPADGAPLRTLADPNELPPGTSFTLKGEDAWIDLDDTFTMRLFVGDEAFPVEAMTMIPIDNKTLRLPAVEGAADDAVESVGSLPGVHPRVRARAQQVNRAEAATLQAREIRDGIQDSVNDLNRAYFPQVWNVNKIESNRAEFVEQLASAMYRANRFVGGKYVPVDQAPLQPQVVREMLADAGTDNSALQQLLLRNAGEPTLGASTDTGVSGSKILRNLDEQIEGMVESDLPPDLLTAYRTRLNAFYRGNADTAANRLTNPLDNNGVGDAIRGDPTMSRVLRIAQNDMADWLERDIDVVLERYHRSVTGRWAVAKAIQSNPDTANMRLANGELVRDGTQLRQYLNESLEAMKRVARHTDQINGTRQLDNVEALNTRVQNDLLSGLDLIEGRRPVAHNKQYTAFGWTVDRLTEISMMNKLGSVLLAQVNDAGPMLMAAAMRPVAVARITRSLLSLNKATKAHLQLMGLWADEVSRVRSISDIENIPIDQGVGTGRMRRATAQIARGTRGAADTFGRVTLMNWYTNTSKRLTGMIEDHAALQDSKRLLRAASSDTAELRRVGLSRFRAAELNKLGLNRQRAQLIHEAIYRHGTDLEGTPLRSKMSMDEYMASKDVVIPNIRAWDMDDPALRDAFTIYQANLNTLINNNRVVTPGVFDRPNINLNPLGRAFNQFQTFGMAFVNQRLRPMSQLPFHYHLPYVAVYLGLGAISDAISNHLSGRRSFEETAKLWQDNPAGMTYAAWDRSGLSGWLARPLAVADSLNLPYAPGKLLGHTPQGSNVRHLSPGQFLTYFGPVATDIDRAARVGVDLLSLEPDATTGFNAAKLVPGQNLVWLRLLNALSRYGLGGDDAPQVSPEAFIRDRFEDREPAP